MNKQLQEFKKRFENGQLAQSFLVVGPEKTGKFLTVVEMVGILNKLENEQLDLVEKGELADIILIETEVEKNKKFFSGDSATGDLVAKPLEKSLKKRNGKFKTGKMKDVISKKQIDSAMKDVILKNFQLDKKVIIIKGADKMTNTATNSLLKLIEEPTENLVIFLLANNEDDLLATIKSRCQLIRFSFLDDNEMQMVIQRDYNIGSDDLNDIMELSRGRIELVREYAKNIEKVKLAKKVRNDFKKALKSGKLEQIKLVDKLIKDDENLLWIMNEWIWYLKIFLEESIYGGRSQMIIRKVYNILNKLLETRELIKITNVSKKVQLENFFVQI